MQPFITSNIIIMNYKRKRLLKRKINYTKIFYLEKKESNYVHIEEYKKRKENSCLKRFY